MGSRPAFRKADAALNCPAASAGSIRAMKTDVPLGRRSCKTGSFSICLGVISSDRFFKNSREGLAIRWDLAGLGKWGAFTKRASRQVRRQNGENAHYSPKDLRQQEYETDHLPCHKSVFDCDMALVDKVPELSQRCKPRRKPMFGDKPKDVPQPFALILVPEFTMMPVTSAIEPLRLANRMSEKALYRWTMHSVDGQPVAASNNILTMVNGDLETVPPHATIIVCGG